MRHEKPGMTSAPLVDGPRVVAVTGCDDGGLAAFDKLTGANKWKAVPLVGSGPGYSAPVIIAAGGTRQMDPGKKKCSGGSADLGLRNNLLGKRLLRIELLYDLITKHFIHLDYPAV